MTRLLTALFTLAAVACGENTHGHPDAAPANVTPAPAEHDGHAPAAEAHANWSCPMHPEVVQGHPGTCPKCGMTLVERHEGDEDHHHEGHGGEAHMAHMADVRHELREKLGAAYDQPPAGLDEADPAKGETLFAQNCATCHGPGGKGDGPAGVALDPKPANFTDPEHARYYSDAGRLEIIRNGIPIGGSAMVGFSGRLSDAGILDVHAYVATLRGAAPAEGEHRHDEAKEPHHDD